MSSVLNKNLASLGGVSVSKADSATSYKLPLWVTGGIVLAVALIFGAYRMYLNKYAFTVGLDYFEPEFQKYWMTLFYIQVPVIMVIGIASNAYLWFTRHTVEAMSPQKELRVYMVMLAMLLAFGISFAILFSLFTEADAAWHQVTIRDTDFTPTHILLFYFLIPFAITALATAFIWLHTRMPDFRDRISLPLLILVAGVAMIMPNVGFNEWGHTFFYAEELFAAPIHYGFVTLGWAFFAVAGLLIQIMNRLRLLTSMSHAEPEVLKS
ncbi:MAG TPA: methane monooxygenase/ammonia monooxygenase subunit C [Pseudomonadales bacterium]